MTFISLVKLAVALGEVLKDGGGGELGAEGVAVSEGDV